MGPDRVGLIPQPVRGDLTEGRYWLEAALAASSPAPVTDRGRVLLGAGRPAWLQGAYAPALTYTEPSAATCRALNSLGVEARAGGDDAPATDLFNEALTIQRELGNRNSISLLLANLGDGGRLGGGPGVVA